MRSSEALGDRESPAAFWLQLVAVKIVNRVLPFAELLAYFKIRPTVLLLVLAGLDDRGWSRAVCEAGKQRKESVYLTSRGQALHEAEHLTELEVGLSR
jgi:hypothetical protein